MVKAFFPVIARLAMMAIAVFGAAGLGAVVAGKVHRGDIIAYLSGSDNARRIYLIEPEHRISLRQEDVPNVLSFAFSADGQQIAFSTVEFLEKGLYGTQLYVADTFGSPQRQMTAFTGDLTSPLVWSPDGRQVAFSAFISPSAAGASSAQSQIFVLDVGSGTQKRLTDHGRNINPSWSPDGQSLLFFSPMAGIGVDIYTVNIQDGNTQKLTLDTENNSQVSWSLDRKHMAFVAINSDGTELHTGDSDGSHFRALTQHPIGDFMPVWSPDGQQIAFQSFHDPDREIYVIEADGSDSHPVVSRQEAILGPVAWSPDSRQIAYAADLNGNHVYSIMIANVDGGERVLTPLQVDSRSPVFMPG